MMSRYRDSFSNRVPAPESELRCKKLPWFLPLYLNPFVSIDKRFEQVDKRFEQVEKRFEQIDKRFDQVHQEIMGLHHEIKLLLRWGFGILLAIGSLIVAVLRLMPAA